MAFTSVYAQEIDAEGSRDHPLVERMPDFYISRSEQLDQDKETIKTSQGRIEVQGKMYYIDYRLRSGRNSPSKIQILNYYQTKFIDMNADMLLDGPYYDVYKIKTSSGETWIKIDPGVYDGKRYEVTVVETPDETQFPTNTLEIIRTSTLTMTGLNSEDRIIKTSTLQMTGLDPLDRIVRTSALQITGLNLSNRIIRTSSLVMTGLKMEDRIIKTDKLELTGIEQ